MNHVSNNSDISERRKSYDKTYPPFSGQKLSVLPKIPSGNSILDKLIGGFESDVVTTIYGPPGSGKTNFCILASTNVVKTGKKVIYVDTDGSFSVERLKQISSDYETILSNMVFFRPTSFKEQKITFDNLDKIMSDKVGLIVIDSIAMLYRLELGPDNSTVDVNRELGSQLNYLTSIARKYNIPIIITNQVYASFDDHNNVKMVGGNFLKYGSKCLIEVVEYKSFKKVILRKHRSMPENSEVYFKIVESGVEEVSSDLK